MATEAPTETHVLNHSQPWSVWWPDNDPAKIATVPTDQDPTRSTRSLSTLDEKDVPVNLSFLQDEEPKSTPPSIVEYKIDDLQRDFFQPPETGAAFNADETSLHYPPQTTKFVQTPTRPKVKSSLSPEAQEFVPLGDQYEQACFLPKLPSEPDSWDPSMTLGPCTDHSPTFSPDMPLWPEAGTSFAVPANHRPAQSGLPSDIPSDAPPHDMFGR